MPQRFARLDLFVVPRDAEARPEAEARALLEAWRRHGMIDADGRAGSAAERLVEGGFERVRLDLPGRPVLYANQTGGFRVRCPRCGGNVVPAFGRALASWRRGGARALDCPHCGETSPLEALDFAPPAAVGSLAVVIADVGRASLQPDAVVEVERHLGPVRVVARRP